MIDRLSKYTVNIYDKLYTNKSVQVVQKPVDKIISETISREVILQKGDTGEPGKDGYTPIKGICYFDGEDGLQGPQGIQGPAGNQGEGLGEHLSDFNHDTIYSSNEHAISTHAPGNAQKNSDITKEEIEAKLIGEISTHTHAGGSGGLTQAQILTRIL